MKTAIKNVLSRAVKLFATPYDVPADAPYSKQSMATQAVIQDAAAFMADRTKEQVAIIEPNATSTGAHPA